MLPAAGIQHSMAFQRGAGNDPFRDSCLTVCPRQAPRHQWMVDGTGRDRGPSLERTRPNLHWQCGNRDLLNQANVTPAPSMPKSANFLTIPAIPTFISPDTSMDSAEALFGTVSQ